LVLWGIEIERLRELGRRKWVLDFGFEWLNAEGEGVSTVGSGAWWVRDLIMDRVVEWHAEKNSRVHGGCTD